MTKSPLKWTSESIPLSGLKEYKHNPRKINKLEFDKLVQSIKEDGYHQRILVNKDYTIIGGHQRKKALIKAGMSGDTKIDILIPNRDLTQQEIDRINVRDNLSFGEYDFDILLDRFDIDTLAEFGMSDEMLESFIDSDILSSVEDEKIPSLPQEAQAKLGDLYALGDHRLLCGDSTNPQHVEKLLDGARPILMVTDPPYGVNYEPEWRNQALQSNNSKSIGKVLNDDRYDWGEAYSLFTGEVAYIWHSSSYTHKFAESIEKSNFDLINLIIWNKPHFVLSRGNYHHKHEPCWYVVKKGCPHNWQANKRDQSTVWDIDRITQQKDKTEHGTQKPIECMLRPILNNSQKGAGVYDPFGGSGTTLIACEKSERNCYMIELSPNYVDLIISRWEKETGEKAVLIGNGEIV